MQLSQHCPQSLFPFHFCTNSRGIILANTSTAYLSNLFNIFSTNPFLSFGDVHQGNFLQSKNSLQKYMCNYQSVTAPLTPRPTAILSASCRGTHSVISKYPLQLATSPLLIVHLEYTILNPKLAEQTPLLAIPSHHRLKGPYTKGEDCKWLSISNLTEDWEEPMGMEFQNQ